MLKFRAKLMPVPHGGQYVCVPDKVATQAKVEHAARVRGEVNGVAYRSSLMKYSGVFHLGIHKAVLKEAGVDFGETITVSIERDNEPLPSDIVPDDLAAVLKQDKRAAAAWKVLRPSMKREHVKSLLSAKKPETRARRLEQVQAALVASE
jgi:hypothetical protein